MLTVILKVYFHIKRKKTEEYCIYFYFRIVLFLFECKMFH